MSRFWTYQEMKAKVDADLDLEGEIFVDDDELLGYFNEGIDLCEGKIHSLYEDYFLSRAGVTLVNGTSEYALPSDIYGHKIRSVIYKNNSDVYVIPRIKNVKKLLNYELETTGNNGSNRYEYFIINSTAGSPKMLFSPDVAESGEKVFVWYLRQANRLAVAADVCDIPEFVHYVIQYAKVKVCFKEGHPNYLAEKQALVEVEQEMLSTLACMVPDEDNQIEADYSFYEDMA
jgi:hypothetical protein